MKTYKVIASAWMYGKHYSVGSYIKLNEKQAKYEIYSGTIDPIAVSEAKADPVKPKKPDMNAKDL